ncbi:hypothetical protein DBR28_00190 [Chryseobacterium sp. HMWF028]|nr:hypothetical protein DBR28_00190 [Chryseobacterium sp. HMWF028]
MKLLELIQFFRNGGSYEELCQLQNLDIESEVIEIYMKQPLKIDNDLGFFEIEKTEGKIEYSSDGIQYSNLFDFYYFLDAIEEAKPLISNEEPTKILYNYAINDA